MKYKVAISIICFFLSVVSFAQKGKEKYRDNVIRQEVSIFYHYDQVTLDSTYLDNATQMKDAVRFLEIAPKIDSITIISYASPEGTYEVNVWLAKKRAETARDFILNNLPDKYEEGEEPHITLKPMGENWKGLYDVLIKNYDRTDRDKVLDILEDSLIGSGTRKWRLQQLDSGKTYKYIIRNYMPRLRSATWLCVYEREAVIPLVYEEFATWRLDTYIPPVEMKRPERRIDEPVLEKKTVLTFKTNLLYDAVTALNVEAEVCIGNRFSAALEYVFPWWTWGPNGNKYAVQILEMGLEPRWWFYRNEEQGRLQGHFAGVYGMSAKFDLQWDKSLCYQGYLWSAGLTYGYSLPLTDWMNMELSLSVGFLQADYKHYQPADDYSTLFLDKFNTGKLSYFGPTKAKVSLSFPIKVKTKKR